MCRFRAWRRPQPDRSSPSLGAGHPDLATRMTLLPPKDSQSPELSDFFQPDSPHTQNLGVLFWGARFYDSLWYMMRCRVGVTFRSGFKVERSFLGGWARAASTVIHGLNPHTVHFPGPDRHRGLRIGFPPRGLPPPPPAGRA